MRTNVRPVLSLSKLISLCAVALTMGWGGSAAAQEGEMVPEEAAAMPTAAPVSDEAPVEVVEEEVVVDESGAVIVEEDDRQTAPNVNLEGGVGFHKIASARPGGAKTFRAAFMGEFYSGADTVRQGDEDSRAAGHLLVQGTLTDFLAFNFGLLAKSNVNTFGQPEAMLTQGDMNLGLLAFYPVSDAVSLGLDLNAFLPATFGSTSLDFSAMSFRPRLLATLDGGAMSEGRVPLDVHLNVGYLVDRSANGLPESITDITRIERFAYGISAYDLVELAAGFELDLPYVRPFLGYWMGLPVNGTDGVCTGSRALECATEAGIGAAPKVLSLGLKGEPVENFGLHAGVDLGLTTKDAEGLPVTMPYNVIFGLSWTIDPKSSVEYIEVEKVVEVEKAVAQAPVQGFLMGSVIDEATNESVKGAVIEYVGQEVSSQASSAVNGKFRSYGFEPGKELTLRVTHPDYETLEVPAKVQEGEIPITIALKALPKVGTLTGRVLDEKDKAVSGAQVTISGEGARELIRVDGSGNFTKDLKAGRYTIAVSAEDYLTRGRDVELKADDTISVDIVLLPKPKKELAKLGDTRIEISDAVYFDTNEATIQARSFGLLNQVAAILLENPRVQKIQIEGHTDDRGAKDFNMDLSQRRAEAVRKYLIDQGISADRLVAKGFGPTRPILPNTSNRNRALNRRVEFNIVEQGSAAATEKK